MYIYKDWYYSDKSQIIQLDFELQKQIYTQTQELTSAQRTAELELANTNYTEDELLNLRKSFEDKKNSLTNEVLAWLDITEISDDDYQAMLADNKAKSDKAQKEKADAQAKILKRLGLSAEEFATLLS